MILPDTVCIRSHTQGAAVILAGADIYADLVMLADVLSLGLAIHQRLLPERRRSPLELGFWISENPFSSPG